jgi:hypothetical protein
MVKGESELAGREEHVRACGSCSARADAVRIRKAAPWPDYALRASRRRRPVPVARAIGTAGLRARGS